MTAASFTSAVDAFDHWTTWIGDPDPQDNRLHLGCGFEHVRIAPEVVTLLGGMPGAGKTALVWQWLINAMEADSTLSTLVANVEMPPRELLNRQLARLSGLALTPIRERRFAECDVERRDVALERLQPLCQRLTFLDAPYTMTNLVATATDARARLIVVDYAQRFGALDDVPDKRQAINSVMDTLRLMANHGAAVVVLSSLSRGRDSTGRSTYNANSMSLASFKESGELEYGADDALLLCPRPGSNLVDLKHEKSRYGEQRDLLLEFDRPHQSFSVVGADAAAHAPMPERPPNSQRSSATPPDILAQIHDARIRGGRL